MTTFTQVLQRKVYLIVIYNYFAILNDNYLFVKDCLMYIILSCWWRLSFTCSFLIQRELKLGMKCIFSL